MSKGISHQESSPRSSGCSYVTTTAGLIVAIIVLLGTIAAAGTVYSQDEFVALAIGGASSHITTTGTDVIFVDNSETDDSFRVRAVNASSGKQQWQIEQEGWAEFGGVASGTLALFVGRFDRLIAIQTRSGEIDWTETFLGWRGMIGANASSFFFIQDQDVVALDAQSGTETWRFGGGEFPLVDYQPAAGLVGRNLVVAGGDGRAVVAIDPDTGTLRWTFPCENGAFAAAAALLASLAISDSTSVYGVDSASGDRLWTLRTPGGNELLGSGGGMVFAARGPETPSLLDDPLHQSEIVAVDGTTGAVLWQFPAAELAADTVLRVTRHAVFDRNTLYVSTFGNQNLFSPEASEGDWLYALDAATGIERWRTEIPVPSHLVAVTQGIVLVSNAGQGVFMEDVLARIVAYDALTGEEQWSVRPGGIFSGEIHVKGEHVYALSGVEVDELRSFNLESGQNDWSQDFGLPWPAWMTFVGLSLIISFLIVAVRTRFS
ncbi:MAG: PQQ-binding-like beta-propeller repeat protein [Thermomicrobiales bacterium]